MVSQHLNRRFSQPLSARIIRIWPNCNPNLISIVSAIIGFMGAFAFWDYQPVMGGILVQISSIVDGSDGEIARATGRETYFGGFFDSILDRYVDFTVLTAMAFFSLLLLSSHLVLLLATMSITGSFLVSYTAAKTETNTKIIFSRTIQGRDTRLLLIFLAGVSSILTIWSIPFCLIFLTLLTHGAVFLRIKQAKSSLNG
ncbi:MAG: CDP-alcohol phosphatidyltransferase family protein [Candidatus Hodarchaeales archaeon]